ncbi:MAG: MBOAT family O-acyltransferase [Bacteroidota bacterium]
MLFNSFDFIIFFPVVTILFFLLPHKFRWSLLLTASCVFYMYFIPVYILILFFTIIIDYIAGIYLEDAKDHRRKKFYLAWSLVANIGVLAVFKYYNFFLDNFNMASLTMFEHYLPFRYLAIALPIGLSFHTFQAMSYTFEVYYGRQKAERHFGLYALYVMFYPQLVAGPIERPQNILHQFHEKQYFNYARVRDGLSMMLWGLFKKVVIADNLSNYVNLAYHNPDEKTAMTLLLASYFFAIQIYCDFSGYSDIAVGAAKVMGFNLMENFRTPYASSSIREFWGRWHISLSSWFRDYLYIPLGGNRVAKWRWMFNLFLVFMISGIWHGANWTYVIWGALHGLYLVFGILKDEACKKWNITFTEERSKFIKGLNILITFHLALFAWIFFRANTVTDAFTIIEKITTQLHIGDFFKSLVFFVGNPNYVGKIVFHLLLITFFVAIDPFLDQVVKQKIQMKSSVAKLVVYSVILASVILFGYFGEVQFIYFQF